MVAILRGDARAVAIHEAGHALAHYLFRVPIASVSIVPDDISLGRCRMSLEAFDQLYAIAKGTAPESDAIEFERIINAHMIIWLAGPAAESRYRGRSVIECLADRPDVDWPPGVLSRLMPADPGEQVSYQHDMHRRAVTLMADADHWRAVEALADVLECDREIGGEIAAGILAEALLDQSANPDLDPAAIEWMIQEFDLLDGRTGQGKRGEVADQAEIERWFADLVKGAPPERRSRAFASLSREGTSTPK